MSYAIGTEHLRFAQRSRSRRVDRVAQQSRVPRREEADADLPLQRALLEAQTEAVRAALAQERAAREAAVQRSARLHALHRAALELSSSIAPQPQATAALLGTIVQRAVEALHAHDGWVVLAEDSVWRHLVPGSGPADGHVILDFAGALRRRWLRLDGAEMHVLETGETVEVPDTLARSGYGPYAQLAQVGIHAFGIAPLRAGGGVLGLLGVTFRQSG